MTKEEFENGIPFRVKGIHNDKGSSTYYFHDGTISKQIRSNIDERTLTDDYHLNVNEVSNKWFSGFVYVMDKKVNVKYKFEDLVVFEG
jgi:hypothetical protein